MAGYAPASLPSLSLVFDAPSNSVGNPASLPSIGLLLGSTGSKTLAGAVGSYAMNGIAAALKSGYKLASAAGSYAESGVAATLTKASSGVGVGAPSYLPSMSLIMARAATDKLLSSDLGVFTLTGVASALHLGAALSATVASYIFNGAPAQRDLQVTASGTAFAMTGVATAFTRSTQTLTSAAGSFAMTGVPAGFAYQTGTAKVLPAEFAAFVMTGNAATLPTTIARVLSCDRGSFAITANSATLTYVGWSRVSGASSTWTNVSSSSTTWTT